MEAFEKGAISIVDMMEDLANFILEDDNVREYFIEHYRYEEYEDATCHVLRYIEDKFFG